MVKWFYQIEKNYFSKSGAVKEIILLVFLFGALIFLAVGFYVTTQQKTYGQDIQTNSSDSEEYVLICIGMSNAMQECDDWLQKVNGPLKESINEHLTIINCAVGGHAIERWNDPAYDAKLWDACTEKIKDAKLQPSQVQFVWHKAALQFVRDEQGEILTSDSANLKLYSALDTFSDRLHEKFPSVEKVFISGRSYGGFAENPERGEPFSFQSNEVISSWVEQNDYRNGIAYAVGPYLWGPDCEDADTGSFCYERKDYQEDGIHPASGAKNKITQIIHDYFNQFEWYYR